MSENILQPLINFFNVSFEAEAEANKELIDSTVKELRYSTPQDIQLKEKD